MGRGRAKLQPDGVARACSSGKEGEAALDELGERRMVGLHVDGDSVHVEHAAPAARHFAALAGDGT